MCNCRSKTSRGRVGVYRTGTGRITSSGANSGNATGSTSQTGQGYPFEPTTDRTPVYRDMSPTRKKRGGSR